MKPESGKSPGTARPLAEHERGDENRRENVDAKLVLAAGQLEAGNIQAALALLSSAREQSPQPATLARLAEVLRQGGRQKQAAAAIREWSRASSELPLLRSWASVLLAAGEVEEALLSLQRARGIDPRDAGLHFELGRVLAVLGRHDEAVEALAEACRIAPAEPRFLREYVALLSKVGRPDDAIVVAERLRGVATRLAADSLSLLGGLLVQSRRMAEAEARFRDAVVLAPEHFNVRLGLARALRGLSRFDEALEEAEAAVRIAPKDARGLTEQAVALDALGRYEAAIAVEDQIAAMSGRSPPSLLRLARVLSKAGQLERAVAVCDEAITADGNNVELHRVRGSALAALARRDEAAAAFETALALDPLNASCLAALAMLKQTAGEFEAALALLDRAIAVFPTAKLYLSRSEVRYRCGDAEGSKRDASAAVAVDPGLSRGAMYLGFIGNSADAPDAAGVAATIDVCIIEPGSPDVVRAAVALRPGGQVIYRATAPAPSIDGAVEVQGTWRDLVHACSASHVLVVPGATEPPESLAAFKSRVGDRVGIVGDDPARSVCLWRRDLLVDALGVFDHEHFSAFAAVAVPRLSRRSLRPPADPMPPLPEGRLGEGEEAWLCSPEGVRLVGGVERYLRSIAEVYRNLGYRPVLVAVVASMAGRDAEGEADGFAFLNVSRDFAALRTLALERNPALVHATSGVGLELSGAFDGLRARTVYGMHFWSEMFLGSGSSYERLDVSPQPRPGFGALAASFDQIYANSDYTAGMLGASFDIGAQRNFPIGIEVDPDRKRPARDDRFLLLSGRPDKGLDLVLEVAKQMPTRPFGVVSPLGLAARTRELVAEAGLANVEVIDWTPDTTRLYRSARAVLVPSYRMIETFSRVTVEAQSFGIPVVGSDSGNVGILLGESGVALPEDPATWAAELERLWTDDAYWRSRAESARANALRFAPRELARRTTRIVRAANLRVGVGVGCGVGNIVQCTPAIRRISEHFGAPVDILLREDFPGSRALLEGSPYVGSVIPADRYGPLTRFDSLLILDGFGPLLPRLNADRLLVSKEHFNYHGMGALYESRFNLMCAERLLGVDWREEDVGAYFVGNVARRPVPGRIGLHAGCKPGIWLPKRWPYFAELAERLSRRGYELVSFGGPDEYVEGTTNETGTDLATTIRGIATCSYFIANDSGLMHVADALGIPLTAVFAPTSVERYGPIGPASRVVRIDRACSPCQFDTSRLATCQCIADIPVATVAEAVDAGLAGLEEGPPRAAPIGLAG